MRSVPLRTFVPLAAAVVIAVAGMLSGNTGILTPDRKGFRLYLKNRYNEAAATFSDPVWKGVALFKAGEFKAASAAFSGTDTPVAAYNQGNALLMAGLYEEAVSRYERALELQPQWEDPRVNGSIALARAEALRLEGGQMTGGMLGADDVVFSEGKSSPPGSGEEVVGETSQLSEAEMQALWLRQVQTRPADFLRSKFSYQYAMQQKGKEAGP